MIDIEDTCVRIRWGRCGRKRKVIILYKPTERSIRRYLLILGSNLDVDGFLASRREMSAREYTR